MTNRVAGKIKLQSVDELLGVPEISGTQEIEIARIHEFPNHPFKVLDDERMDLLVDSIRCSFSRKMQNVFASFAKTYFKNRKRTF